MKFPLLFLFLMTLFPPSLEAEALQVRAGDHAGFTRFVFPFSEKIQASHTLANGEVVLHINSAALLDFSHARKRIRAKANIKQQAVSGGQEVRIPVKSQASVKTFYDKNALVIDVYGELVSEEPSTLADGKTTGLLSPAALSVASIVPKKELQKAAPLSNQGESASVDNGKISTLKDVLESLEKQNLPLKMSGLVNREKSPKKVMVKLISHHGQEHLVFSTSVQFPTAVFQRGNKLWMFVDTTNHPMDLILAPSGEGLPPIEVKQQGPLYAIGLDTSLALTFNRTTDETVYTLNDDGLYPDHPVVCARLKEGGRDVMTFPIGAERLFTWEDPDIGDTLIIGPTAEQGKGVDERAVYIDLEIIPSYQGLVIKKITPDVQAFAVGGGVMVDRVDGLRLSFTQDAPRAHLSSSGNTKSIFDFSDLPSQGQESLAATKVDLQEKLRTIEQEKKAPLYLVYGKALLKKSHFKEAQSVFSSAVKTNRVADHEWRMKAFYALASLLARDDKSARTALLGPKLRRNPEALFLRGLTDASRWNLERAKKSLTHASLYLRQYPDNIRAALGVRALKTAIHVKDYGVAGQILDVLQQTKVHSQVTNEKIQFYKAQYLISQKNIAEGAKILASLEGSENPRIRAKAILYRTLNEWEKKTIDDEQALKQLEPIRLQWRRGAEYREVIDAMISLLLKNHKVTRALSLLRQAYNKSDLPADHAYYGEKISKTLVESVSPGHAEKIPVLSALAMFVEFKSFLHPERDLPQILYPLLLRLEAVDLLSPAIELLEERLKVYAYLDPDIKLSDQTRLIELYIANENAEKALIVLESMDKKQLSPERAVHLKELKLKALIHQQRFSEGLQSIADDKSMKSELHRALIYWQMSDWTHAAASLETLLAQRESLEQDKRIKTDELVLMLTIAYNLLGKGGQINGMQAQFGDMMKESPLRADFEILTTKQGSNTFRTIHDIRDVLSQLDVYKSLSRK